MPLIPLDQLEPTLSEAPFWLEQILLIALFFFIAWVVYRLAPRMASRIVRFIESRRSEPACDPNGRRHCAA